jgi:hypothetical protein
MASLREFIAGRRDEIKKQIAALKGELRDLDLAEAAIKTGTITVHAPAVSTPGKPTIKEMVLEVLSGRGGLGVEASEIIALISNRFGEEVPRSSLSPQLSRLKEDGLLDLEGRIWKIASSKEDRGAETPRPSDEFGGGEVRGRALPTESPEGASPSTSISDHLGPWRDKDD